MSERVAPDRGPWIRLLLMVIILLHMPSCGSDRKPVQDQGGADNPTVDNGKWTLLHKLVHDKKTDEVAALLAKGARVNVNAVAGERTLYKTTALHIACTGGDMKLIGILLQHGANVNASETTGNTPLHNAIERGDLALVELLLEKGADVNAYSFYVNSPLKLSRDKGFKDIAKLLESKGAKEN